MSLTKSRQWHLEHLENSSADVTYNMNADFVASLERLDQIMLDDAEGENY